MAKRLKSIRPATPAPKRRRRLAPRKPEGSPPASETEEAVEEGSAQRGNIFYRYCEEIDAHQLLTPAQEVDLAKTIETHLTAIAKEGARKLAEAADVVERGCPLKGQVKLRAARRLLQTFNPDGLEGGALLRDLRKRTRGPQGQALCASFAGPEAKRDVERFANANLRLVIAIAKRYRTRGSMTFLDIIQSGNLGLMRGVLRFDWRRGYRFSTCASWWIRHAIQRDLGDYGRTIRIPVHQSDFMHKIDKTQRQLTAEHGRPATEQEIADAIKTTVEKVRRALKTFVLEPISLDKPIGYEDGATLGEATADDTEARPDAVLETADTAKALHEMLAELRPIEQDIIHSRFGIGTDEELTLKEIGEKHGLSRERIRQIQEVALKKLRRMAKYDLGISA